LPVCDFRKSIFPRFPCDNAVWRELGIQLRHEEGNGRGAQESTESMSRTRGDSVPRSRPSLPLVTHVMPPRNARCADLSDRESPPARTTYLPRKRLAPSGLCPAWGPAYRHRRRLRVAGGRYAGRGGPVARCEQPATRAKDLGTSRTPGLVRGSRGG
jgi:hypothetical protein